MKRYLLDTGIAGEYIGNRGAVFACVYAEQAKGNHVGICVPVLAELVFGVEYSSSREINMRLLLKGLRTIRLWPFGKAEAFEYGRLNAHLRKAGRPMQVPDVMIAAVALLLGKCTVVSKDSDFLAVPGLAVENWAA